MNRKDRRKNKIVEKDPVLCIKRSEFNQKMSEMYDFGYKNGQKSDVSKVVNNVFTLILGLPCKVLHDNYGWGLRKRLPEFAQAVVDLYEQFDDSTESFEQMQEFIYQETGIKFLQEGDE